MDAFVVSIAVVVAVVAAAWSVAGSGQQRPRRRSSSSNAAEGVERLKVRLLSRLLFARRVDDAITLDCTLEDSGLPFTLQLHAPETEWFAGRIENLLAEWADEDRELVLELSKGHGGKVRAAIASGGSSVQLELVGAAGLGSHLR